VATMVIKIILLQCMDGNTYHHNSPPRPHEMALAFVGTWKWALYLLQWNLVSLTVEGIFKYNSCLWAVTAFCHLLPEEK
jgi:hypothetical protein